MMKSRAHALPPAHGWDILRAVIAWIRDPIWIGGLGVQTLGYALYVVAVAGAPVSMVAVMMQGGIALFVVCSIIFLGERARLTEWAAIGAIVVAMALLSISLSAGAPVEKVETAALAILSICAVALAASPFAIPSIVGRAAAYAIASGIAFGMGALYTKAMADAFLSASGVALAGRIVGNPFVYGVIVTNVAGTILLQNSFRDARGIIVVPISSALSNVVPIAGGIIAFGEHLPPDFGAAAMRVAAFAMTIGAGAMLATAEEETVEHASSGETR